MNLKKRLTAALLSAALALSLVACGSPATQESPSTAPSPSAEPASAGHTADDMIVLAGARTLAPGLEDVYFSHKLLGAWEPLISVDESGNPMGVLAESWERNEDATVWTFHLRQGVNFQNGAAIPSILHSRWTSSTPASLAVRRSTTTPSMSALPTPSPGCYLT